ncbi:MAG: HlyD family efflux transporter periplasmic adaptor subunit [Gammaproteobacteria bacterium]|nr:MAG: HlyD family efflux transporter periplasmic adaptor subunit [Gammaproteobacteria bacterium]
MQLAKILLTTLLFGVLSACTPPDNENRVVGELASERIELSAEVAEPIVEILVAEGEAVSAGDILLRQNADRANARLVEATAALAQSQARLDELLRGPRTEQIRAARANVTGAVHDLDFRSADFERAKEVFAKNLASPDTLDRAKAAYDAAGANLSLRRAQLEELLTGTTVEELTQAEQTVRQFEARRELALIDVDRHEIRAPMDGITDSRLFELGERPLPGQPLMILLAGEQPYARVYVPERLRVRIKTGTRAKIYVDGLENAIEGRVRWVASEAAFTPYFALTERDRGRLSFVAKIDITEDRERLPDGVPVEVEFLLGSNQ